MMVAAVVIAAAGIFAGCKKDKETEPVITKIEVTGVWVCPTAVMLYAGNSTTILANVMPDDADDRTVTWTSDKPDVASVNEKGVVTAHAMGEAAITCTTNDGGKIAKATVIVNPTKDEDDYGTLVLGFYLGDLTMEEETVGTGNLITVKYDSENKAVLSIDEKFKVPQLGNATVPIKVDCIADVTKVENGYKVEGTTTATLSGFSIPVAIDGVFTSLSMLDLNINVELPATFGGDVVVNFKGVGNMAIEPCAVID
jgi:hypothetical protein